MIARQVFVVDFADIAHVERDIGAFQPEPIDQRTHDCLRIIAVAGFGKCHRNIGCDCAITGGGIGPAAATQNECASLGEMDARVFC